MLPSNLISTIVVGLYKNLTNQGCMLYSCAYIFFDESIKMMSIGFYFNSL